jgi:hypothetical protein
MKNIKGMATYVINDKTMVVIAPNFSPDIKIASQGFLQSVVHTGNPDISIFRGLPELIP